MATRGNARAESEPDGGARKNPSPQAHRAPKYVLTPWKLSRHIIQRTSHHAASARLKGGRSPGPALQVPAAQERVVGAFQQVNNILNRKFDKATGHPPVPGAGGQPTPRATAAQEKMDQLISYKKVVNTSLKPLKAELVALNQDVDDVRGTYRSGIEPLMLEVLSGDYLRSKGLNQGDVAAYCFDGHSAHRTARQTGLAGLDVRVATARRGNSALAVSLRKESEDHLHPRVEDKLARYWLDKGPEERVARAHPRDEVFEQYAKVLDSIDGNDYWERAYNKYMRAPKQIFAQDYPYWDRKNPQAFIPNPPNFPP